MLPFKSTHQVIYTEEQTLSDIRHNVDVAAVSKVLPSLQVQKSVYAPKFQIMQSITTDVYSF